MRVPSFLVRQFYVDGSLQNTESGFSLQAHNALADGMLVGVGEISVDGAAVPLEAISAVRDGVDTPIRASEISRQMPVTVRRGERVTLHVDGVRLTPGSHELEVELVERDLGALQLSITESLDDDGVGAPGDASEAPPG